MAFDARSFLEGLGADCGDGSAAGTLAERPSAQGRAADLAGRMTPAVRTACELFARPQGDGIGLDSMTDEERERWAERAAIREYCGGRDRDDAERAALAETLERRINRKPS